jgi:hypothetical protein
LVESNLEIWDEIDSALGKGKVEATAAALRRHLEYVSRLLADQLGAAPQFRADGNYELGDLLPSVLARMKDLYGKAAAAAQSWRKNDEKEAIANRKAALSAAAAASKDFQPVVSAFKTLLACFRCDACESWMHITPRLPGGSFKIPLKCMRVCR